jgi:hypothetical protein
MDHKNVLKQIHRDLKSFMSAPPGTEIIVY